MGKELEKAKIESDVALAQEEIERLVKEIDRLDSVIREQEIMLSISDKKSKLAKEEMKKRCDEILKLKGILYEL